MRVIESCAECLYKRQQRLTDNKAYLAEIRDIIDNRGEKATAPYLVYRFNNQLRGQSAQTDPEFFFPENHGRISGRVLLKPPRLRAFFSRRNTEE